MPASKHPVYILTVDCQQLELQVYLNDVPVLNSNYGKPLTCELPANLQVIDGKNLLEVRYSPPSGAEFIRGSAAFRVTLFRNFLGEAEENRKAITAIDFKIPTDPEQSLCAASPGPAILDVDSLNNVPGGAIEVGEIKNIWDNETKQGSVSRPIKMFVPFAQWSWLGGDLIKNDESTFNSLLEEYQRLWEILNDRKPDAAFAYLSLKIKAVAAAWNMTEEQARDTIEIGDMLRCDEIELRPLCERGLKLEVFGNGRLASIVDRDGDSPVYFREKDGSLDHYIPLIFCLAKGQWQNAL